MGADTGAHVCLPCAGSGWLLSDPSPGWKISEEQEEDGGEWSDCCGVHRQYPYSGRAWSGASILHKVLQPPTGTIQVRITHRINMMISIIILLILQE